MVEKRMGRRCSHCGNNGHNSRTCSNPRAMAGGALKLFGVQLHIPSSSSITTTTTTSSSSSSSSSSSLSAMKKSFSMDCLSPSCLTTFPSPSSSSSSLICIDQAAEKISGSGACAGAGYLSDGLMAGRSQARKKGVPWTEEEHRAFLAGLEKLGKGDWRGISRSFVPTRTPTQVASHAQKYFLRKNSFSTKKKRRSSLFDADGGGDSAVNITGLDLNSPHDLELSLFSSKPLVEAKYSEKFLFFDRIRVS
ncbi:Transcription factor DIVARICATA [Apostasia shenzhenica]|uniref:Transcription factor DIVARICATA n=1 Tax=Apostasia shenzhenica TaxID=1088818 RepID=A0A2I0ANV6_9ASPA|nr:Transcription factor DIVARICATA [Apostasia shenzhenica]